MDLTFNHMDEILSKYAMSIHLLSLVIGREPLSENTCLTKIMPAILTCHFKNKSEGGYTTLIKSDGGYTTLIIVDEIAYTCTHAVCTCNVDLVYNVQW